MTEPAVRIPVVVVKQNIGDYYSGVVAAGELLRMCRYDWRRMRYNAGQYPEFLGIQRKIDDNRVKKIVQYVGTVDACFPTSVVLSVDERCVSISETEREGLFLLEVSAYEDPTDPELNIPLEEAGIIIDGQHRLKGLEEAQRNTFELSVSVFVGIDEATQASLFSVVNLAQTKVNRSLVYDLFSFAKERSPERTCHEIVVALDQLDESPFSGRIKRLGTVTEGRFGETLSQATVVKGLLPYLTRDPVRDRDIGKRFGFWDAGLNEFTKGQIFFEFFRRDEDEKILANVMNYFLAVAGRWRGAWSSTGRGNMINRTNGFNAFARFLRPAYLHFTTSPRVVSEQDFAKLFDTVGLDDGDFNTERFVPGSSGATMLYRLLVEETGVAV